MLDNLTQQARTYISQLYVNCQQSYDKGVHLYQDIVESIISKTLDKRIDNAENEEYEEMKDINTIGNEPEPVNQYQEPSPFTPYKPEPDNQFPSKQYIPSQIDVQPNVSIKQNTFIPYSQNQVNPYSYQKPYQEPVKQYQELNENPYQQLQPLPQEPYQEHQEPYQEPFKQPYEEPQEPFKQEPVNQYPYQQPYQEQFNQEPVNSDIPTVYTNNDKHNQIDNILVSSLRYSNNKGILSDRGVTEQLNKVEFEKNNGNIGKNNM